MPDATSQEPVAPDLAERAVTFARACKGAARSVSMYPDGHPAVRGALTRLVEAVTKMTESGPVALTVVNDRLLINGASPERPDPALGELATLLHSHIIGRLDIQVATDAGMWLTLFKLLARPTEEVREEGGIAKLFTGTGAQHLGVSITELDYSEILEERSGGASTSLDDLVTSLLEGGDGAGPGDAALEALVQAADDEDALREMASLLRSRTQDAGPAEQADTVLKLLRGLVKHLGGKSRDEILQTMGRMTPMVGKLSADAMSEILEQWEADSSMEGGVNVVEATVGQMGDDDVARFVAGSVEAEGGSTERLAQAFQALVPEGDRRRQVLAMAEEHTTDSAVGQSDTFPELWGNVERMLTSYSDEPYVSTDYARELSAARRQAVEVDQINDDPPERMKAWLDTVADDQLQEMDFQLVLDLLELEPEGQRWRDIANIATSQIDALLREGQFVSARRLLDPIAGRSAATNDGNIGVQARELIERLAGGRALKRGFKQVRQADDAAFDALREMCAHLGSTVIGPLAEAMGAEEDGKVRKRLHVILKDFGDAARDSIRELMRSPSREVRRTALLLLRELGGSEALDALAPMLKGEPSLQRDALRSMLVIDEARAHDLLVELLKTDAVARDAMAEELTSVRDDRAAPLCGHLIAQLDHRVHTVLYVSAIEALGRLGSPGQVEPLKAALYRGEWWAPVRTKALRAAAAEALRKIGAPATTEVLREAAQGGPWGVRAAARPEFARVGSRR